MLVELISAMDEPSPPPATNAQGSTANKAEMKRPSSPVALCLEGPLHEPHTQGPASDTSQQTLHTLPGLDFLQSDDPLLQFALPFQGAGSASHGTGQSEFDIGGGGGQMFSGLASLGFNLNLNLNDPMTMSLFPSVSEEPQVGAGDDRPLAGTTAQPDAGRADADAGGAGAGMPDFALLGDTLTMWPSMPPTFG